MAISVHTKKPFLAQNYSHHNKEVKAGEKIQIEKLHGTWVIQTYHEHTRYEKNIKEEEIFDYVDQDGKHNNPIRDLVNNMKQVWHSSYGIANDDEIWATAIDNFFKLPLNDRKAIANLIAKNR